VNHESRRRRTGFTLIEVAVVVSITSVLFALSITTIVALLRVQRQIQTDAVRDAAIARLADRLRADAHAATSADCTSGCKLDLADGTTIHYAFTAPSVTREVRRAGAVEHRDSYFLGKDAAAAFSLEGTGDKHVVMVKIAAPSGPGGPSSLPGTEITAAVNRYGRP
jgi:prepilin-type N-terminal cleavage/methylation domain-containing protein